MFRAIWGSDRSRKVLEHCWSTQVPELCYKYSTITNFLETSDTTSFFAKFSRRAPFQTKQVAQKTCGADEDFFYYYKGVARPCFLQPNTRTQTNNNNNTAPPHPPTQPWPHQHLRPARALALRRRPWPPPRLPQRTGPVGATRATISYWPAPLLLLPTQCLPPQRRPRQRAIPLPQQHRHLHRHLRHHRQRRWSHRPPRRFVERSKKH